MAEQEKRIIKNENSTHSGFARLAKRADRLLEEYEGTVEILEELAEELRPFETFILQENPKLFKTISKYYSK